MRAWRSRWCAAAGSKADRGPDERRGRDEFVPLSWDAALDLLGAELRRVRDRHGAGAVFGGSYGWSSAGRFHHAQSQLHRFLNVAMGGYVRSVNTYSSGAASVLLPHVIGDYEQMTKHNVTWEQIVEHSEIVVAFGGMALKNSMVAGGSVSQHVERGAMARARARGCRFVNRESAARRSAGGGRRRSGSAISPAPTPP